MNKVINTLDEFNHYKKEGYYERAAGVIATLDVSETKGRELLKDIERIDISEKLYHELKKTDRYASRSYYNDYEVFKELVKRVEYADNGKIIDGSKGISVEFGDMRKVFSEINNEGEEMQISKDNVLDNAYHFYMLFKWSKPIKDIILEDLGYKEKTIIDNQGTILYAKINDVEYKTAKEIITKSLVVKYTRMIKRDFYVKFTVGKKSIKYFQSMRQIRAEGISENIGRWIKEYEASIK